jgi:hypothetical protein
MAYTTIMGAMAAIQEDERWQAGLTEDERRACLQAANLKFHDAMTLTFSEVRARLAMISKLIAQCPPDKRVESLKVLLE